MLSAYRTASTLLFVICSKFLHFLVGYMWLAFVCIRLTIFFGQMFHSMRLSVCLAKAKYSTYFDYGLTCKVQLFTNICLLLAGRWQLVWDMQIWSLHFPLGLVSWHGRCTNPRDLLIQIPRVRKEMELEVPRSLHVWRMQRMHSGPWVCRKVLLLFLNSPLLLYVHLFDNACIFCVIHED